MTRDPLDTGYVAVAETYGALTGAPRSELRSDCTYASSAHAFGFLPDRRVPIRTAKTQFLLYVEPFPPANRLRACTRTSVPQMTVFGNRTP